MTDERAPLLAAITALQQQRALLGDAVVDAALVPMRARLAMLADPLAKAGAVQSLRQVSVLFLDVVGSTALSATLDPEDVHAVIDGLLQRCTAHVSKQGGHVLQYAGDSLLAAFGAEGAQEDDAERAVHCALALLAEGRALRRDVLQQHGHDGCNVRVGIHTGPVLLGGGVDDEGSIRGLAVNIAARMEQTAPVGALRISHDTWLLVRGAFECQAQAPLQVKGSAEPLRTYLVQRPLPAPQRSNARGLAGAAAPLHGRDAELARVLALPQVAMAEQRLAGLTLLGEPGVGKSRLLHELQAWATGQPVWLMLGRANPPSRLQPYGLLRNLLAWRLQIADSAPLEQAKTQLLDGLLPWLGGTPAEALAKAQAIGQLIGLDFSDSPALQGVSPGALRRLAFAALQDHLRTLGAGGRMPMLLLEDLHWADEGSLEFVAGLLQDSSAPPLVLLATARPELLERHPAWAQAGLQHTMLTLEVLSPVHAQALAAALLRHVQGSAPLQARLVALADGNPFFMEELVRMCLDQGVIVQAEGNWQVLPDRLAGTHMPTTLVGVLQARLDALPASQRRALQQASIVGHVFWDRALAALDQAAPAALPGLYARLLVQQRPQSSFEDSPEQAFRHHLLQQVTYDTVLRPARQAGHAAAAQWLAERMGDRPAEFLAATAQHYERAGDLLHAADYYERAAKDASRRYANAAALEHGANALRCLPVSDLRRRFALHHLRQHAADTLGLRGVQEAEANAREALARELGDDRLLTEVLFAQSLLASRRGDEKSALALAERTAELAARTGAVVEAAMAQAQLAWSRYTLGELDAAQQLAERAVAAARRGRAQVDNMSMRTLVVQTLTVEVVVQRAQGARAAALAGITEALALAQVDDLRIPQANLLLTLGVLASEVGEFETSIEHHRSGLAVFDSLGLRMGEASCCYNIAGCLRALGRAADAREALERAKAASVATEHSEMEARCWLQQGHLHADAGETEAAHAAYARSASGFETCELPHFASQSHAGRAALALAGGALQEARDWAELAAQGMAAAPSLLGLDDPTYTPLVCHRVWLRLGDERATSALERAVVVVQTLAQKAGDPAMAERIRHAVPLHREVLQAWAAMQARTGAAGP